MTTIHADLEAIQSVRAALLNFANRVHTALPDGEIEIERAAAMLDRAEAAARRRMDDITRQLYDCHAAAMYGYPVNCGHIQQALWRAEQRLTHILHVRRQFELAVNAWRSRKYALESALENDLAAAVNFLDRRITAVEGYYAATLTATALDLGRSGVPWLMPAAIGALRLAIGRGRLALGRAGEEIAAAVLSRRFDLQEVPFTQPAHGFDRVFCAPGLPLIVVESKASHDGKLRLSQTNAGAQGSPGWNAQNAASMVDPTSAQWSPANARIGRLVQEMGAENVPVLAVVTDYQQATASVYARQADGAWKVNQWLKKAVLLSFRLNDMSPITGGPGGAQWWDKV
ncbi:MAG: hypothetical protein KAX65_12155, partial [Caldilineaceae bacterium]|nr:hypothetical protein [Caldilineaceae bacterium]